MCVTYLGYLLLLWFPGVLHAQSAAQPCVAPRLPHGYIVPEQDQYATETKLTYACEKGYKPAVEGWWATSTCQSGTWSPEPECIVEQACIPPTIPNAKYSESLTGWYKDGQKIWITCDKAYKLKDNDATTVCTNGSWSSVPVCERSVDACGAPPKVPHAVIMDHGHQELFAADTELRYECEDGYTAEGAGNDKTIVCIKGAWTKGPTCSSATAPGAGQGGSTEGATGGSETQPAGSSTNSDSNGRDSRPPFIPINDCGLIPLISNGYVVEATRMYLKYRCGENHTLVGPDTVVCYRDGFWSYPPVCKEKPCVLNPDRHPSLEVSGYQHLREGERRRIPCIWTHYTSDVQCINGEITYNQCRVTDGSSVTGGGDTTSAGSWTPPAGGGSSSSSASNTGDTERHLTTIDKCGTPPDIPHAVVVRTFRRSVRYRCYDYHKRLGPEYVRCYSDGTWSELPTCQASYCVVNTLEYPDLKPAGEIYVEDGETRRLECVDKMEWWFNVYSDGQCNNGVIHLSRCCTKAQLAINTCGGSLTKRN